MQIRNKVALVTGAAHRVGKAIALRLAGQGATIVLHYRSAATTAQETEAELAALGAQVLPVQADLSDEQAVERLVQQAINQFGQIDILINSAASFERTPFPDMTVADWDRVINTNLRGPFLCAKAVAPHMLKLAEGNIINIVDLFGFTPGQGFMAHSIAKAGLMQLTMALALELRPTIRVNGIAPGPVLPPADYDDGRKGRIAQRTLLKRWGAAEDVARTVQFLLESDYITAEIIRVDGGELIGHRDRRAG